MMRRRGTWLLLLALGLLTASVVLAGVLRYQAGLQLHAEAGVNDVFLVIEPVGPAWLRGWVGEAKMRPLDRIVSAEGGYGSPTPNRPTRRPIDPEFLWQLSDCGTLRELLLDKRGLENEDMAPLLRNCPRSLERLSLRDNRITGPTMLELAQLPGLKTLEISVCPLTRQEIDRLRIARPALQIVCDPFTRVGLWEYHYRMRIHMPFRGPNIKIWFRAAKFSAAELARLADVPRPLQVVVEDSLSYESVDDARQTVEPATLSTLAALPNMQELWLQDRHLRGRLGPLGRAVALEALTLGPSNIAPSDADSIAAIKSLRELTIFSNSPTLGDLVIRLRELRPDVTVHSRIADRYFRRSRFSR